MRDAIAKTVKIYRNGVIVVDSGYTGTPNSSNLALLIGSQATCQIGDVLVYNRTLSAEEIAWLHREPYAMCRG